MSDDKKQSYILSLDTKEFIEGTKKAQEGIEKLGDAENISGLVEGLMHASKVVGVVGVAVLALKTSFDLVQEAEEVKKTNALFEQMATNAGLAAHTIKEDLAKATGGLADDTDVLKAASKAMLTLGDASGHVAEVMQIARKYTASFGGELIENFEKMSYAVGTGNTRLLKHMGIVIDAKKSVDEFAKAHDISAKYMTEAGRQQAVFTSLLDFSNNKLKENKDVNESTSMSIKKFGVSVKEVAETIAMAWDKIAGPSTRGFFSYLSEQMHSFSDVLKIKLGIAVSESTARIEQLNHEMARLGAEVEMIKKRAPVGGIMAWILGDTDREGRLKELTDKIAKSAEEINAIRKKSEDEYDEKQKEVAGNDDERNKKKWEDQKKLAEERRKLEMETLAIQEENNKFHIETANTTQELDLAKIEEKRLADIRYHENLRELERQYQEEHIMNKEIFDERKAAMEEQHRDRMLKIEEDKEAQMERMNERYLKNSQGTFDGVGRAAEVTSRRAQKALNNFGKTGMMVMGTVQKRGGQAFHSLGEAAITHSQSASQIMKGFFLNSLGDIAEAYGALYIAAGVGGDYAKLAAGAGLMALAGILHALAGSAGGGGGSAGLGGAGGGGDYSGGGGAGAFSGSSDGPKVAEQKSVTVNIAGHLFETEQTKTRLMEMIRESTDATDFKYVQIGGK